MIAGERIRPGQRFLVREGMQKEDRQLISKNRLAAVSSLAILKMTKACLLSEQTSVLTQLHLVLLHRKASSAPQY